MFLGQVFVLKWHKLSFCVGVSLFLVADDVITLLNLFFCDFHGFQNFDIPTSLS